MSGFGGARSRRNPPNDNSLMASGGAVGGGNGPPDGGNGGDGGPPRPPGPPIPPRMPTDLGRRTLAAPVPNQLPIHDGFTMLMNSMKDTMSATLISKMVTPFNGSIQN